MPTLDWIGKQAVVNHHREVPYRLIHCDSDLSAGAPDAGNLLVQGDNLQALRALLPYYAGKVKCIYIDPPYNTGNEGWVYNDNVNSPEIRKWLGEVVGKESEDLSRHDNWLCMMYPRLRLLREFLREDGVIFVSIDDHEQHYLLTAMAEIFGIRNHLANVIWEKSDSPRMDVEFFSSRHDFIVTFGKRLEDAEINRKLYGDDAVPSHYNKTDESGRRYYTKPLRAMGGQGDSREARPNLYYAIEAPDGSCVFPKRRDGKDGAWRWSKEKLSREQDRIEWVGDSETGWTPYFRIYADTSAGRPPETILFHSEVGSNRTSKAEVNGILRDAELSFDTPKPTRLLERLIEISCGADDLILDSFAGSGTTGQAVLNLNKQDGGSRRFILVEMEEAIARDVTAERLRRVITGYDKGGDPDKPVEGLGGGFRYCRLGEPLFDEFGDIASEVRFPDLAAHIFFAETGVPIPQKAASEFLGVYQDRAVYLLFDEASAHTPREAAGNVLTPDRLSRLPDAPASFEGVRVVYAEGCTVSAGRLKAAGVTFKQIPYQVEGV
jgi:adenine-specific DNA-methyltransferase